MIKLKVYATFKNQKLVAVKVILKILLWTILSKKWIVLINILRL